MMLRPGNLRNHPTGRAESCVHEISVAFLLGQAVSQPGE